MISLTTYKDLLLMQQAKRTLYRTLNRALISRPYFFEQGGMQ
jgi:hypothetical protein